MRPIQLEHCEHYSVNSEGVVINTETGRVLKTDLNNCGYKRVTLWRKDQTRFRIMVHRLVALHYLDKPKDCDVVNHKDGNKINNHYSNLEWTTTKGNTRHAFKTGLRTGPGRLSMETVDEIRDMQSRGIPRREIARHFGIKPGRIDDIRRYYR